MFMCSGSASAGIATPSAAPSAREPDPAAITTRRATIVPLSVATAKPARSRCSPVTATFSRMLAPLRTICRRTAAFASRGLSLPSTSHSSAPSTGGPRYGAMRSSAARSSIRTGQAELFLAPAFRFEKRELLVGFGDHQAACEFQLDVVIQLRRDPAPLRHRLDIHRQRPFQAGDEVRIKSHETALHLHMQAAGVGVAAAMVAGIDADHRDARRGEKPREAQPDDAAADHHGVDPRRQGGRRHGGDAAERRISVPATRSACAGGAKQVNSSSTRLARSSETASASTRRLTSSGCRRRPRGRGR